MAHAKKQAQRIAIWIAIIGFVFSSVALTLLAVMGSRNQTSPTDQQALLEELQKQQEEAMPLPLEGYSAEPFDPASVSELKVEVLKEGSGPAAGPDSTVSANYFGWTSDGIIFDSSNQNGTTTPIEFPLTGVIEGWSTGLVGVKEGSVVKLTIPAEMAYGSADDGSGRPFGPLVFIVELTGVS